MILSTMTGGISRKLGDEQAIKMLAEAGYDAYDFTFDAHAADSFIYTSDNVDYFKQLRKLADSCGIACNQAHAPAPSSVGDPDKDKEIYKRIIRSMEAASVLGAKIIVVHPVQHLTYAEHPEELFEMNVEFYKSLIPYCEQFNIKVAVENMWQYNHAGQCITDSTCSRAWEFCKYIDAVDSEWIVGCLDIGHVSLVDRDITRFIRDMGNKRLQALHVHDTDFKYDLHTLPFDGKINFPEIVNTLREIDYQGDFTYEADCFLEKFPVEFFGEAAEFMCKVGRFLIK